MKDENKDSKKIIGRDQKKENKGKDFEFLFATEKEDTLSHKLRQPLKEYMWKGLMCFLVIVASIAFAFIVMRFNTILDGLASIIGILRPIICGFVFAYLLNPIMKWFEKILYKITKSDMQDKKEKGRIRGISLFLSILFALVLIIILVYTVIPDLIVSISNLVKDLPKQFHNFTNWVQGLSINEKADNFIQESLVSMEAYIENWIKTGLLEKSNTFVATISDGVFGFLGILENVFVGLIVSIYVLSNKEHFSGQTKKVLYATCSEKTANVVMELVRDSNRIFMGFLSGKIIDSFIIGLICFAGLSVLRIPYTLIVSVIIGVTNIIPFFGPYIGAIPSALLILLTDTKAGIIFIIFVVILQQIDGNLLGPKILGNSTGLSAFWVIFAIIVGSGLFGFPGMILGVPTFAVIYHIIAKAIDNKLKRKQLSTNTDDYCDLHAIKDQKMIFTASSKVDLAAEKIEKNEN